MGHKYLVALLFLVFFATGCGKKKNDESTSDISVSAFNSGFSGGIYFDSKANGKENFLRLDLRTGTVDNFLDSAPQMTSLSTYGDRIVTVKRSRMNPEVQVLDRSKSIVARIALPENPEGTPKLSRNGDLIIQGGIAGDTKIFNLQSEVVKNLHSNISSYDWLADGRLIFSRFGTLYIMQNNFDKYEVFWALPGLLNSLSVSPDGNRIAFSMTKDGSSHIWIVDLLGQLRQVTTSKNSEFFPSWSPNGNQIVLAQGKLGSRQKKNCLELWVVNANQETVIDLEKEDLANTLRVKQNVLGQISQTCTISAPHWRDQ